MDRRTVGTGTPDCALKIAVEVAAGGPPNRGLEGGKVAVPVPLPGVVVVGLEPADERQPARVPAAAGTDVGQAPNFARGLVRAELPSAHSA